MKKLNIFHPKKRPNSQELPTAPTDTLGRIVNAKEEVRNTKYMKIFEKKKYRIF